MVALAVALTLTGCSVGSVETRPAPALEQVQQVESGTDTVLRCMGEPVPAPATPSVPTETVDIAEHFHNYYSAYYAAYCDARIAQMARDA